MKIYNLGSLNIDYVYSVGHIVRPEETLSSSNLQKFAGGKGLNQSVALSRAGCSVIHGGIIGTDGQFLKDLLQTENVGVSNIKTLVEPTGHAIIQVDSIGQNSILLYSGTNYSVDHEYIVGFLKDAQEGDILLLQNEVSAIKDAFEIAHYKKMQIAFNPSPYSHQLKQLPLQYVKWWFCNEIEAKELFFTDDAQQVAQNFLTNYPDSNLILTLGEKGSVFISKDAFIKQEAYKTKVVDTTAAGDTFTGYFLSAVSQKTSINDAMRLASKAASITVSRKGASPSIPYFNELV